MPNPVVHFEIITSDPDGLAAFYRDTFGWNVGAAGAGAGDVGKYLIVKPLGDRRAESAIDGGIGSAPAGYNGHVTIYIAVDDVGAALDEVEKNGGKRMMGPQQVPGGPVIGLFVDPQEHTVGLVKVDM